jgi:sialate O-acetylesterase
LQGKPAPSFPTHYDMVSRLTPGVLYNAMIAPLTHFPIRGVIWYQGENNASVEQAPIYAHLFQTLIRDWRRSWGEGDFPFLFVQLSNLKTNSGDGWPELREAQMQTLGLKNTAMAVTIDIGDPNDVHFKNKQDVGHRLALAARAIAYGEPIEYSGPLFRMQSREEHALRIWFDHSAGLVAKGGLLAGFEIAGADMKFLPADARIDGQSVVVSNQEIAEPVVIRYSWKDNPNGNLYNQAGLPASPFRSRE